MITRAARRRTRLVAGVVAVVVGVSALTAATAHAETWTHRDKVDDVWQSAITGAESELTKAPRGQSVDIRRVRISHTPSRVVVVTRAPRIARSGHTIMTTIRTPTTSYLQVLSHVADVRSSQLIDAGPEYLGMSGEQTFISIDGICPGLRARITPGRTVRISIPRRCLGNPTWVRLGQTIAAQDDTTAIADDALSGGPIPDPSPRMSKRLFRA